MTAPIPGPTKGECQGNQDRCNADGCPLFGTLGKPGRDEKRRVRGCNDPVARGKRNRTKGDSKARNARKRLGLVGPLTRHEEHWRGALLVEVKAGAQVGPLATKFRLAKAQSDASRAIGDSRPFALVAMPDGSSDGIIAFTLSDFQRAIVPLLEEYGGVA